MKIIDPHIHLFNLEQGDYHWLRADNPPFWPDKSIINKTFEESDLMLEAPIELAGFVHIEAGFDNRQPWRELATLEQSSRQCFRAIANIDLTELNQNVTQNLERLVKLNSFVGVRHILDKQALSLLTNKHVLSNFKILNNFAANTTQGLIFETQLELAEHEAIDALCDVICDNPNITFIINHAGFPPTDIQTIEWQRWQSSLLQLSRFSHVVIKCSGWEMTDRDYQPLWFNECMSLVLNIFGVKKVMLASNFPLCLFNKISYQDYWQSIISSAFFQARTKQEKSALCHDNALKWYYII